jgi:hypothetical protein
MQPLRLTPRALTTPARRPSTAARPRNPQSWASSSLAYAPKGRLLSRLQHYPWALSLLPAALLALLLPGLARSRALHFADCSVEARYAAWFNRRHVAADLAAHCGWLAAATALFVQARSGGGALGADAAALAPLALLGPCVPAALAAALCARRYAERREGILSAARLAQTAAALAVRAAAPGRLDAAWPLLALMQLTQALLMRVRFSIFLPAQLLHVLAAICGGGGCATGAGALLHFSRLVGFGWCAPSLLVFGLETYSRRAFAHHAWAHGAAPGPRGAAAATAAAAAAAGAPGSASGAPAAAKVF